MNILKIKETDALNGPGVRCSIWVAGCNNKCKGCWASDTWNSNAGTDYSELKDRIKQVVQNPNISGISLLGGDPFYWAIVNPDPDLLDCLKMIKENIRPDQDVWCWTGYTLEFLESNKYAKECLTFIDYLVDQKFDITKKDLSLKYRGSSNQRIIDLKKRTNVANDVR